MEFLAFAGFLAVSLLLLWLLLRWARPPGKGQSLDLVLIGAASGQAEMEAWRAALRTAGIWSRVQNVGDHYWYGTDSYAYEVWVLAKDAEVARQVLGFG